MSAERGSALMLMPAAVLVLIVLGSLALDAAIVFLGERTVADLAAGAANDAAVAGLAEPVFYRCGALRLDPARSERVVSEAIAARSNAGVRDPQATGIDLDVDEQARLVRVTVTVSGTVDLVFARALPGPDARVVQATATATARQDPSLAQPPAECASVRSWLRPPVG